MVYSMFCDKKASKFSILNGVIQPLKNLIDIIIQFLRTNFTDTEEFAKQLYRQTNNNVHGIAKKVAMMIKQISFVSKMGFQYTL